MSILYLDGFDGYTTAEIPTYWSDQAIFGSAGIVAHGRGGGNAMNPAAGGVARGMGGQSSVIIAAAFQSTNSSPSVFSFKKGGTAGTLQIQLLAQSDGTLSIIDAAGVFHTCSAAALMQIKQWAYIEWKTGFTHSSLNEVRVNGQLVFSGNVDGQNTLTPGADTYYFNGVGGGDQSYYDDHYILRTDDGLAHVDFIGDSSVICGVPSGDGPFVEWTPLTPGAHFNMVKEIPCDLDTTYNSSGTSLKRDTYVVSPTVGANDAIPAVQLTLRAEPDTGSLNVYPYLVVAGTGKQITPSLYTPVTYNPNATVYEFNPVSTAAWTPADINSATSAWGIQIQ